MSTGLSCQTGTIFRLAHTIEAASNRGNALMSLSVQFSSSLFISRRQFGWSKTGIHI